MAGALIFLMVFAPQDNGVETPDQEEAWAPGFEAGDFTFYPSMRTRAQYDDNIFLEDKDRNSDVIFMVTPGIAISHQSDRLQGFFSYEYTEWYHADHTVANRDEQRGAVRLNWSPSEAYFRFGGNFDLAAQPIDTAFANLVEVRVWSGFITAGYDFGETRVELDTVFLDFSTPLTSLEFYEYNHWGWTLRVLHRLSDEVAGSVEFTYGRTAFSNGDVAPVKEDNDLYRGRLGAIWVISPEVEAAAHVGYEIRDYETGNGSLAFVHDYEGVVFDFSVSWMPDDENRLTVRLDRTIQESVLSNFTSNYGARAVYSRLILPGWDVTLIGSYARGRESTDAVTEATKHRLGAQVVTYYSFLDGLTGELAGEFRNKRTDDDTSEYENLRVTVGLKYDF